MGSRRIGGTLPLVAMVCCLGMIGTVSAAWPVAVAATASPESSLYMDVVAEPSEFGINLPLEADWHTRTTSDDATIVGETITDAGASPDGFQVSDGQWIFEYFKAGSPVTAGTFVLPPPNLASCATGCAIVAAIGHGSCAGPGTVAIHEIAFDPDGSLVMADVDFDLACGSGSVRFHANRDTVALDQDADRFFFADTTMGQQSAPRTITVTNIGTVATSLGQAALSGDGAADYQIVSDACSGSLLGVGATCQIATRFVPTAPGIRIARLEVTDGTSHGRRELRLIGAGFQQSTLQLEVASAPQFGPAPATIVVTVTPPAQNPWVQIDGEALFQGSATSQILPAPTREVITLHVSVGPGHHVITSGLEPDGFYLGASAGPVEIDVGTSSALSLTTATDDGVEDGESATLVATLRSGVPVTGGTIRIRDAATDEILASSPASGAVSTVEFTLIPSLGSHAYAAEFVPPSPDVQDASAEYALDVVAGPRPETSWDPSTLYSTQHAFLSEFSSPDADVTFQCRVDLSNWFPCTSPAWFTSNSNSGILAVRAVSADGLGDRSPATRPYVFETTPPTATGPIVAGTAAGSAITTGAIPVRIGWTGHDAQSGIDHYALSVSTDGGSYKSVAPSLTTTTVTRSISSGHTYRFAVRPVDRAGNVGALYTGVPVFVRPVSQSSAGVHYHGTWSAVASSTIWWGGTAMSSSTRGSTVSYAFTGKSIAWVGLTAATRGKAQVYVNGVLKATVDLYSATTLKQRVVWSANYATSATRTITIKVLGTSGRPRVDIDGFIVAS